MAAFADPDPGLAPAVFAEAAPETRRTFAEGLASTVDGARALLDAASPSELLTPSVKAKLEGLKHAELQRAIAAATAGATPPDAALDERIAAAAADYAKSSPDRAWGGRVFARHCALCHQLAGEGKVVGPQLDGVHTRGATRLIEDILAPSRHVDPNFHVAVITRQDGSVVTGIARGESGGALQLVDATGALSAVPLGQIASRQSAPISIMPPGFADSISPEDFHALLGFLLHQPEPGER